MSRLRVLVAAVCSAACLCARADAVEALRAFVRDVGSGQAAFTQTVTSADGARKKVSSGEFEFVRPDRFRFSYDKPYPQLIVADGSRVWIYDVGLNQASSRRITQALGATPAALLAGAALEREFVLTAQAPSEGLEWALAIPRARDGAFQSVRVGLRSGAPAVVEITDGFGQRSRLEFRGFKPNVPLVSERFRFVPPAGADVIEQ